MRGIKDQRATGVIEVITGGVKAQAWNQWVLIAASRESLAGGAYSECGDAAPASATVRHSHTLIVGMDRC